MKCYLPDKAVGGGVGGGAPVRALESALPFGVLSLSGEEQKEQLGSDGVKTGDKSGVSGFINRLLFFFIFWLKWGAFGAVLRTHIAPLSTLPASPWLHNAD